MPAHPPPRRCPICGSPVPELLSPDGRRRRGRPRVFCSPRCRLGDRRLLGPARPAPAGGGRVRDRRPRARSPGTGCRCGSWPTSWSARTRRWPPAWPPCRPGSRATSAPPAHGVGRDRVLALERVLGLPLGELVLRMPGGPAVPAPRPPTPAEQDGPVARRARLGPPRRRVRRDAAGAGGDAGEGGAARPGRTAAVRAGRRPGPRRAGRRRPALVRRRRRSAAAPAGRRDHRLPAGAAGARARARRPRVGRDRARARPGARHRGAARRLVPRLVRAADAGSAPVRPAEPVFRQLVQPSAGEPRPRPELRPGRAAPVRCWPAGGGPGTAPRSPAAS